MIKVISLKLNQVLELLQNRKIMRIIRYCIVLLLVASCSPNKHFVVITTGIDRDPNIFGEPRFDVIDRIYDNLLESNMPKILSDYYRDLKPSDYYSVEFRVDTTKITPNGYSTTLFFFTRKAKDGYLFVNKGIMDEVASLGCGLDKLKISYVYNNKAVTTKEDVMRILGLREKRIQISEILQDEQSGMITVYILDR